MTTPRQTPYDEWLDSLSGLPSHEIVSRCTVRIEQLFEARGGRGVGLMQKAQPFNYALSERAWDDLCWLNSEGRGVAEYDSARFCEMAKKVLLAVDELRQLATSRAPSAPPRPRAERPRGGSAAASLPSAPSRPRKQGGSGFLRLLVWVAIFSALFVWRVELLDWAKRLLDAQASRPQAEQQPTVLTQPNPLEAQESARPILSARPKLRKKLKAPSALSAAAEPAKPGAEGQLDGVTPPPSPTHSARAASAPAALPDPLPPAAPPDPEPREPPQPRHDAGDIHMTRKQLDSF